MIETEYPIRAAAKLTGLSVDTLRAWERRYQAVTPGRQGRGRVYSETDIERLKLLHEAVQGGHSIGQLASLDTDALRALRGRTAELTPADSAVNGSHALGPQDTLNKVMLAIGRYDTAAAEQELNRIASLVRPRELVVEVVLPLLEAVGVAWETGRFNVAHEHMSSALLRNLLGTLLRIYVRPDVGPRLLFATPGGELHEFGVLSAAMLAASDGFEVVYLGPNLPAADIVDAARGTAADVVVLGVKGATDSEAAYNSTLRVAELLPARVALWVGGQDRGGVLEALGEGRGTFLRDIQSFEGALQRLREQAAAGLVQPTHRPR